MAHRRESLNGKFFRFARPQDNAPGAKGRSECSSHGGEEDVVVCPADRLCSGLDGVGGGPSCLQVYTNTHTHSRLMLRVLKQALACFMCVCVCVLRMHIGRGGFRGAYF